MVPKIVSKSSAVKAREKVKDFYRQIIEKLSQGVDKKNVMKEIVAEKTFGSLKRKTKPKVIPVKQKIRNFQEKPNQLLISEMLCQVLRDVKFVGAIFPLAIIQ